MQHTTDSRGMYVVHSYIYEYLSLGYVWMHCIDIDTSRTSTLAMIVAILFNNKMYASAATPDLTKPNQTKPTHLSLRCVHVVDVLGFDT